jgi:hypothetical protein
MMRSAVERTKWLSPQTQNMPKPVVKKRELDEKICRLPNASLKRSHDSAVALALKLDCSLDRFYNYFIWG